MGLLRLTERLISIAPEGVGTWEALPAGILVEEWFLRNHFGDGWVKRAKLRGMVVDFVAPPSGPSACQHPRQHAAMVCSECHATVYYSSPPIHIQPNQMPNVCQHVVVTPPAIDARAQVTCVSCATADARTFAQPGVGKPENQKPVSEGASAADTISRLIRERDLLLLRLDQFAVRAQSAEGRVADLKGRLDHIRDAINEAHKV
jgi:hypothetical protein